ncbi:MAG: hypothetical protein JWR35_286 [Marmoricola sp.]|jgi:hypothetical protein|nr:hypothetical protein [Marmoricola sp.]
MDTLRITDAERDAAVASLGEHYAVGRLTKQEFDDRSDVAWQAKTRGELVPLFADLPRPETAKAVRQGPAGISRRRSRPHRRFPAVPFVPIIIGLIALTAITHLPFIVFGLLVWFVLGRRAWHHHGR